MTTLTVGTGQQYTTIAAAVAATKDGDTVLVQAGTYTNDFFDVQTKITLQSVGGLAIIAATVSPSNGKGAVVVDNDVTIDGFGFTGVGVGDGNGAGIRYDSGKMVVRNSVFWNNQNGILANADPNGTILIQNSEFSHNGAGDGYTHNIYINAVASLTVQNSYFHDSVAGHEIKSRALSTTITGNRIQDLAGDGSYSIDLPDGGLATVTGNTIEKGPNTQNNFTIHYGGEGAPYAGSALTVSGNTLISDNPAATLLLNQTTIPVALTNNALWGFSATQIANGPVVQSGNTTLATEPALNLATLVPATLTTTTTGGVTTTTPITTTPAPPPTTDLSLGTKLTSFGTAGAVVASGHVLTVGGFGTGAAFSSLQSALAASQDGDTIQLAAGTYVNDFGVVNHKVIIEGVGGIARMVQQNDIYHASGILVVNTDVTIMNMEFTGTASDNGYAPGVAINAGNATIVNSRFDNNEVGLRANDNPLTNLSIYNSDIGSNGNVYRGTNNLQVGAINSLTMVGDYVHGATSGHEVYDRAFNTDIENTRINDGAGYASSFLVDLGAGGNAKLVGDTFVKGANATNGVLVHVGGEVTPYLNSKVQVDFSTLITQYANLYHPYTYFISAETSTGIVPVTATADTFVGGVPGSAQLTNVSGTGNVAAAAASIASTSIDTSSPVSAAAAPAAFTGPTGPNTLTLRLAQDASADNAEFLVSIDGKTIGGGMVVAASGSAGQIFSFNGTWSLAPHQVSISFINPRDSSSGATDLIVQSVQLGSFLIKPNQVVSGGTPYTATVTNNVSYPDFDANYYLTHNPDVAAAGVDPLIHYLTQGFLEGRNPNAWFDTKYYLKQNPDVAASGQNPLVQYETVGWKQGRDPSLMFSDSKYLAANPDVAAANIDPLQQYIQAGQAQGRATFLTGGTAAADPLVNAAYYDAQLGATLIPAGAAGAQQAAASYAATGWQKGLNPDAWFDTNYYLAHNPDVAAAHVNPLLQYETVGWTQGRDPSALFSTNKYIAAYADIAAAHVNPLLHYVNIGQSEGRQAFAV